MNTQGLDLQNYGIWYTPFWKTGQFTTFLVILTILIILISLVALYFIKKNKAIKIQDPIELILKSLYSLESKSLDSRQFYTELIFIFKQYLTLKYNINLLSSTDDELLVFLKNKLNKNDFNIFQEIIYRALNAKFASKDNNSKTIKDDLKITISIIKNYQNLTNLIE